MKNRFHLLAKSLLLGSALFAVASPALAVPATTAIPSPAAQPPSGTRDYDAFVSLFDQFRAWKEPQPVNGVIDYSPATVEARRQAETVAATTGRLATEAYAHADVLEREAEALARREEQLRLLADNAGANLSRPSTDYSDEEWRQIFNDAWRFERDMFYDPNMHGVDWEAIKEQYGQLVDYAVTRWDINYIIGEMIGEISASHTYRGGGDVEEVPQKAVGYLGIDWGLKEGAYYVKRIVKGAPWDSEVRSALDQPGVNISEGDYILAALQE